MPACGQTPHLIAATATARGEITEYNTDNKEWVKAEEKATGLLWRTVTKDLQLVLNNHQVVITRCNHQHRCGYQGPKHQGTLGTSQDPLQEV
jgi:metal-dependent hydrolase (beta-lactamase superfamily II)